MPATAGPATDAPVAAGPAAAGFEPAAAPSGQQRKAEPQGERMCIVTRQVMDEADLLRFVRAPDGTVVPDLLRKLPGRGVWVCLSRANVAEAIKRQAFARGFGEACQAATEMPDQVGKLLRGQAISHLSLARKAGQAVQGAVKVDEALRRGPVRLLLHAAEAAADGRQKLDRLAQKETLICNLLHGAEMDLAFGRANVIHAAIAAGGLADKMVHLLQRMARYEGLDDTGLLGQKTRL